MGVVGYNLIWFVGFLTALYGLARQVWGSRYSAALALVLALLHPFTYSYLYLKDADLLCLTTAALIALYRYYDCAAPPRPLSWRLVLTLGTVLGWLVLCRPNVGLAFVLFFALTALWRAGRDARSRGLRAASGRVVRGEALVGLLCVLWCVPFMVHSMREWGTPFFTANGVYQMPLGTRFAMGTDTWWKYTDPAGPVTMSTLVEHSSGELVAKFLSSWMMTAKRMIGAYALELMLACWLLVRSDAPQAGAGAAASPDDQPARGPLRMLAWLTLFAAVSNLAVLPLYGAQKYGYHREYLGFIQPFLWVVAGHGLLLLGRLVRPHVIAALEWMRRHRGVVMTALLAVVLIWNLLPRKGESNTLFSASSSLAARFWLVTLPLLIAMFLRRWLARRAHVCWLLAALATVIVGFRPSDGLTHTRLLFFPTSDEVPKVLRQRSGLVMSFATSQGAVAWMSGRQHVPAPELVMHLYSLLVEHGLEVEDLYIESGEAMIANGPFEGSAPGFEGYARLERWQAPLPGYQLVFHDQTLRKDFKGRVVPKASTIYRLTDRAAALRVTRSPDRIDLGDTANTVFAAYGFGDYYTVDGRRVIAATDRVNRRRVNETAAAPAPAWETSAVAFFVQRDRLPTSVDLDFYETHPRGLDFFWNLDLFRYDGPAEHPRHLVGSVAVTAPGWQHARLLIPPALIRVGVNKLGFRPTPLRGGDQGLFQPVITCPPAFHDAACLQVEAPVDPRGRGRAATDGPPLLLRVSDGAQPSFIRVSVFAGELEFGYSPSPAPRSPSVIAP